MKFVQSGAVAAYAACYRAIEPITRYCQIVTVAKLGRKPCWRYAILYGDP